MKPGQFPRSHLIFAGVLSLGLCSFVVAKFTNEPEQRFSTDTLLQDVTPDYGVTLDESIALPEFLPPAKPEQALRTVSIKVKPGDNLFNLFKAQNISPREIHRLSTSQPLGPRLKNIFPGHELTFVFSDDDTLVKLAYSPGPLEQMVFERVGDAFEGREVLQEPERLAAYKHGTIDHSLFIASQRAGIADSMTMRLAQIFQWDVDFVLDIRKGDSFFVIYEELFLEDEFIGYGDILAAEFINQKQSYQAVLYTDENGSSSYYSPTGNNMRKAFLRAPLEFSRISSNFNLRRKHPLHKTTMPHRGIDYAAPVGTPILAAGDGRIQKAGRNKSNGNYLILHHGEQFVTKYLHLSKFARGARSGSKVKQGQIIGYVGATGWATGPHLHYEFLQNGVHRNPRTVKLPDAHPIPENDRPAFEMKSTTMLSLLDNYKEQIQLAFVE